MVAWAGTAGRYGLKRQGYGAFVSTKITFRIRGPYG